MASRRAVPNDIYSFRFVHDPRISPDGNQVLFTVTQAASPEDYSSSIWKYTGQNIGPIISTRDRVSNPVFSKTGDRFLYLSSSNSGSRELWVSNLSWTDRSQVLSLVKRKISSPKWSSDGKSVFFLSDYDPLRVGIPRTDVRLINRMNYRFDGEGYLHDKRVHVFELNLENREISPITQGEFDVVAFDISPDNRTIAFISNIDSKADFQNNQDIYTVSLGGKGEFSKLTDNKGSITSLMYSPDGNYIAFIGDDYRFKFNTPVQVWAHSIKEQNTFCVSKELDRPTRNSIHSDTMMNSENLEPVWDVDSRTVYFTATDRGRCNIYSANIETSEIREITSGRQVVTAFSISRNRKIAFTRMDPTHPCELFLQDSNCRQVSNLNADLLVEVEFSDLEEFNFMAEDGTQVHGFFMSPTSAVKQGDEKLPCVVEIHGGGGTEGYRFMFEFHCLAALGYSVATCNFRGTAGYGEDFMRVLTGHYMEKDYTDIIDMVKYLIHEGRIDDKRVGVTGGSYGGYLTNWAIGHTKLFAAAVTDRSVVNLYSFYGTSDDYRLIEEDVQESFPWIRPDHYLAKSPISFVAEIRTPLLIMHSEDDFRCRLEQAEQLYAFLKRQGKEVEFAIFPDESHGLSRGGKPHHRVERLQLMLWWFTSHIKTGEKAVECPI